MESSTAGAPPARLHLAHVEGMRALAALIVYLNHAYAQLYSDYHGHHASPLLSLARLSMVFGHLAVSVFIVLSGFCLTLPVVDAGDTLRGGIVPFMKRRARRILPPYYGALLLCLALIATVIGRPTGTLWDYCVTVDAKAVIAHALLVQDFFRTARINYVFWSIAVEWQIYFLFPLFVWLVRRWGIWRVAGATMAVGYLARIGAEGTRVARANPHYIGLFVLGMLAAYVTRHPRFARLRAHRGWGFVALACLISSFLLAAAWDLEVAVARFYVIDLPVGIMALALLVYSSASPDRRVTRCLSFRPLAFVGTFSYSVYLVHAPLLQVIWQYVLTPLALPKPQALLLLLTAGLMAVLACAYAFFRLCEEPFMRSPARRVTMPKSAEPSTVA